MIDKATGRPLNEDHSYFLNDVSADHYPLPDGKRRKRVHGSEAEAAFRVVGVSNFVKIERALEKVIGKDYSQAGRILDWGCGCGRFGRYFRDRGGCSLTGVDIDADNVNWCRENMSFGRFETVPLHPPSALADSSFDLLIGISVFTHLKEADQLEWLEELRRIASDGAILLMTVHGEAAMCRANLDAGRYYTCRQTGFLDNGCNSDLDALVQEGLLREPGYYRNVFHTPQYIHETWAKHFEILKIIPGYIGSFQDLVVMRAPVKPRAGHLIPRSP
jgi:SAM-dependent methyltransferase